MFERRRDLIVSKLREIPGFEITPPKGSFYSFPSVRAYLDRFGSASGLAEYLLKEALVAVVPGEGFYAPDHIRFSFATSEQNIIEGTKRIRQVLEAL